MINRLNDNQLQRLEPLYPKWLEYQRVRVFKIAPEQMVIVGSVFSEVMGRRWVSGCATCNLDAFTRVFSMYEKERDRRFKEANDAIGKAVFTDSEPEVIVNTKEETDATPKKKVRRIKK